MQRLEAPRETHVRAPSHSPPDLRYQPGQKLARTLGWLSLGLGAAELLASKRVGKAIGIAPHPVLLPLLGAREIASGVGILSNERPTKWLWSRVAGDFVDMALLGAALTSSRNRRGRTLLALGAVAAATAIDAFASAQHTAAEQIDNRPNKYLRLESSPPVEIETREAATPVAQGANR